MAKSERHAEHARSSLAAATAALTCRKRPMDAIAEHISADPATFASLPLLLARLIFLALPADARGRASCVSRAWRDVLADPALWTHLDLSFVRAEQQRFVAVLHGAAGRARSQRRQLDVSQHYAPPYVLLPVVTANAGSLRELTLGDVFFCKSFPIVQAVVATAPLLQVLTAEHVGCVWPDAALMLRAEPPFTQLRISHSQAVCFGTPDALGGIQCVGPFVAALADPALQPALSCVSFWYADLEQPALMAALVDAALARRLRKLVLQRCTPPPAALLARLLTEGGSPVILELRSLGPALVGHPPVHT